MVDNCVYNKYISCFTLMTLCWVCCSFFCVFCCYWEADLCILELKLLMSMVHIMDIHYNIVIHRAAIIYIIMSRGMYF